MRRVFSDLSFQPLPRLETGKAWRWEQADRTTLVEFLTPADGDAEGIRDLPALGVSALGLRHLDFLLEDPIPAVSLYRSGVLVQLPRPDRSTLKRYAACRTGRRPLVVVMGRPWRPPGSGGEARCA